MQEANMSYPGFETASGFVDGDYVETFLDLSRFAVIRSGCMCVSCCPVYFNRPQADSVIKALNDDGTALNADSKYGKPMTYEEISHIVEELARFH